MKLSQTDRVIAAAKSFRGICQAELLLPDVADNGKPITRLAARIYDAESQGHVFEIVGVRKSCRVYRWVSGPNQPAGARGSEATKGIRRSPDRAQPPEPTTRSPEPQEALFEAP